MKKALTLSLIAALVAVLTSCCGCKGAKSKNPHFLNSHSWQVVEMDKQKISTEEDSFTLTFDDKEHRIFGRGDCNRFFSGYTEQPTRKLEFSAMGSTKMFCPNQTTEDKFFSTLSAIDSYTIDGDMLMLQKNGEVVMIFQAIPLIKK